MRAAAENNIDYAVLVAMAKQESQLNPKAKSPRGAVGVIQLMPDTARELGLVVNKARDDRYDFEKNVEKGAKYYATLHKQSRLCQGKTRLACYNAGAGNVQRHKGIPPFRETRNYVAQITKEAANFKVRAFRLLNNTIPLVEPEEAVSLIKNGNFQRLKLYRISPNFKWSEVFKGRTKAQVEAHFTLKRAQNARRLALKLEEFRNKAGGRKITIISWFRDPMTNKVVGGVKSSQHLEANAADFVVGKLSPKQVQTLAEHDCEGGLGYGSTFTHYDGRLKKARWHY